MDVPSFKIAEIILELTLRAIDVDTVVKREAQSGLARIRSRLHLLPIRIVPAVSLFLGTRHRPAADRLGLFALKPRGRLACLRSSSPYKLLNPSVRHRILHSACLLFK